MGADAEDDDHVPVVSTELYDADFDAFVKARNARVSRPARVPSSHLVSSLLVQDSEVPRSR